MRTAEQIRYLVLAAQREGNRQLMAMLSDVDLTPAQSEALVLVADYGPLALKQLGDLLVCDSGTSPSRIVDRLVTSGLVHRVEGEHDRRQIQLTVTADGADRAAQVRDIEDQLYGAIDSALDVAEADALLESLRKLTTASLGGMAFDRRLRAEGTLG